MSQEKGKVAVEVIEMHEHTKKELDEEYRRIISSSSL